jgi:hypothetical protein
MECPRSRRHLVLDVWRVRRDVRGTYGEVIAEVEAGQRELPA